MKTSSPKMKPLLSVLPDASAASISACGTGVPGLARAKAATSSQMV